MTDRLLTVAQLAELLQVPVKTIHVWRGKGLGPPALRIGRYLRFCPEDVDRWIGDRREPVSEGRDLPALGAVDPSEREVVQTAPMMRAGRRGLRPVREAGSGR
jgi:predicted DNA-binding transcriptional regulator AlpA